MYRQPLRDDIANVPVRGEINEGRGPRFRGNNTFPLFAEMGEVVVERDSGEPCVREVASVSFVDLPR